MEADLVDATREELALTLHEIRTLEASLTDAPDVDSAVRLHGHYDVAQRLAAKIAEADRLEQLAEEQRQTAALRDHYDEQAAKLEEHYADAASALRLAVDTLEQAFETKNEVRRTWGLLNKRGARPGRMPDSFWPRDPQLRNDYINSVLRNGEP